MKTIQGLAELILSPLGLETNAWEVELIKQRILSHRQQLIQQDYSRDNRISQQLVQAFNIKLTKVKEESDIFYISEVLPKPIILRQRSSMPFLNVHTDLQGRNKKPISYIDVAEVPYIQYRKFTKKSDFYTYENNRLIVYSQTDSLRIRAIWDDPIQALIFAEGERIKLNCDESTILSPCTDGNDIYLEETLASRILTFFNSNGVSSPENSNERTVG